MGAVPTGATLGESGPKRESAKAPRTPLGTVHPNLPSQIGDVRLEIRVNNAGNTQQVVEIDVEVVEAGRLGVAQQLLPYCGRVAHEAVVLAYLSRAAGQERLRGDAL